MPLTTEMLQTLLEDIESRKRYFTSVSGRDQYSEQIKILRLLLIAKQAGITPQHQSSLIERFITDRYNPSSTFKQRAAMTTLLAQDIGIAFGTCQAMSPRDRADLLAKTDLPRFAPLKRIPNGHLKVQMQDVVTKFLDREKQIWLDYLQTPEFQKELNGTPPDPHRKLEVATGCIMELAESYKCVMSDPLSQHDHLPRIRAKLLHKEVVYENKAAIKAELLLFLNTNPIKASSIQKLFFCAYLPTIPHPQRIPTDHLADSLLTLLRAFPHTPQQTPQQTLQYQQGEVRLALISLAETHSALAPSMPQGTIPKYIVTLRNQLAHTGTLSVEDTKMQQELTKICTHATKPWVSHLFTKRKPTLLREGKSYIASSNFKPRALQLKPLVPSVKRPSQSTSMHIPSTSRRTLPISALRPVLTSRAGGVLPRQPLGSSRARRPPALHSSSMQPPTIHPPPKKRRPKPKRKGPTL